jgi:hypothetical protein
MTTSDNNPPLTPDLGGPILAPHTGVKGVGSNANLVAGAARGRGEAIRQKGGVNLASGGGAAARMAAARSAGYPAGVLPPHLRSTHAVTAAAVAAAAAPTIPSLVHVGSYGEGVQVLAAELDGSVILVASSDAGENQSVVSVPLAVGTRIELDLAEGVLLAQHDDIVVVGFGFLKAFGGRLLVTIGQSGGLSATWQPGVA